MDLGGNPVEVAGGVSLKTLLATMMLLIGSNVFMTFAWYGLIKPMAARPPSRRK